MNVSLLAHLCCPTTRRPLQMLTEEKRLWLNGAIAGKQVRQQDGSLVNDPMEAGLMTEDGRRVYRISGGIPVMLSATCIEVDKLSYRQD